MDGLFVLIGLALAGWLLFGPLIATAGLRRRVGALERELAALRARAAPDGGAMQVSAPVAEPQPQPEPEPPPELEAAEAGPAPAAPSTPRRPRAWDELEAWVVRHWIVAAGGVTAALGGLFLVRYSIEQGLLGPEARVVLGALVGLALLAGADWTRRRLLDAAGSPDAGLADLRRQVPAALGGAGLVTLYGVVYAAHGLYDLIPPVVAFGLLAAVGAVALAAGLLYGPLAAGLGTGMALLAPALVASDQPDAGILFAYLFAVSAAVLALLRHRPWPWLAWLVLAGNGLWHLGWTVDMGGAQALPRVLQLLALASLAAGLLQGERWPAPDGPWWRWAWPAAPVPVWTVALTVLGGFVLLWGIAGATGYDSVAAVGWGVGLALLLVLARRAPTQAPLLPAVALLTVGLVAAWDVPAMPTDPQWAWFLHGPLLPPVLARYLAPVVAYGALLGAGGFALLWGAGSPGLWAAVSAGAPIALLALLYARLAEAPDLPWTAAALALAALAVAAAARVARYRPRLDAALAAYAAAATLALALAATFALREAWLTVALALELPALAWIWRRTADPDDTGGLPALRALAGGVAAVLLVRLLLNPAVLAYGRDLPILLNWPLYGYGLPAAASWLAARWFRQAPADRLATLLEAAALAFVTALMTLELSHAAAGGGPLDSTAAPLRQAAAVGIGWLALAVLLLRRDHGGGAEARGPGPAGIAGWGWRIIGGAGLAWTAVATLGALNPLVTPTTVGSAPVLNELLFDYGLPALLLALGAAELRRRGHGGSARAAAAAAVLFALATLTLEVRQAFHGARLDLGEVAEAETYAYSAAWLLLALALLAGGLRWPRTDFRHAGFGLLAVAVGKAFLIDMAALTGLWRAASFLGLGLCLIGIGWAYQRFARGTGVRA